MAKTQKTQQKALAENMKYSQFVKDIINEVGFDLSQDQINDTIKDGKKHYYNLKKDCSTQLKCDYKMVLEQFNRLFYSMKNDKNKIVDYMKLIVSKAKNRKEINHLKSYAYYRNVALIIQYYVSKNVAYYMG